MKLVKIAVEERVKQLKRQTNATGNPLIKQILEAETKELEKEFQDLQPKK